MHILTDLLDTYSKLRKRRHSLSEALLKEQGGSRDLALNREFPEGDGSTPEHLERLLKMAEAGGLRGDPAGTPGEAFTAFQSPENPEAVTWTDLAGNQHTANTQELIAYLNLRLQGEEEGAEEDSQAGGQGIEMPMYQDALAQTMARFTPLIVDLAQNPHLDIKDPDEDLEERSARATQIVADSIQDRRKPGASLWSQELAGVYELHPDSEEYGDEAVKEFMDDFGSLLSMIGDAANSEEGCFEVEGREEREKVLNRFFTRDGGSKLLYGALTPGKGGPPSLSAGIQTERLRDHKKVNDYQGTHFARRSLIGGGGENPIFQIIDAARSIKRCGDFKEQLISSTGAKGGSNWSGIRSKVDEPAPLIADAFVKWTRLPEGGRKDALHEKIIKAVSLSVGAIEAKTSKFIELIRDAHGSLDGVEKMYPDVLADAEEFLDHAFGQDAVLAGLVSNKQVRKLAVLTVASYMIPEIEEMVELNNYSGFVGTTGAWRGKDLNLVKSLTTPENMPGGRTSPSQRAESSKNDSALVFATQKDAIKYLNSRNSTHTPGRLRGWQHDPATGNYLIPREHKNVDPGKENNPVQFGRSQLSDKKHFSREADDVYESHLDVFREKGLDPRVVNRAKAARQREKMNADRVNKALNSPVRPAGSDPDEWLRNEDSLDSLIGHLKISRDNCVYPLNSQMSDVITQLEKFQKNPNDPKEQKKKGTLFAETWHTMNMLDGTSQASKEKVQAAAAMAFVQGAASTSEKMVSLRVGARNEMLSIPQSVIVDDLAEEILTGTGVYDAKINPDGIEVVSDSTGFKFYRGGKASGKGAAIEIRYRGKSDDRKGAIMEVKIAPSEMQRRYKGKRGGLGESQRSEMRSLIRETIVEIFEEMFVGKAQEVL